MTRGSTRPDIVVRGVAIEIKGPTGMKDLQSIADKFMRYQKNFPGGMICVLFNVLVSKQRYNEWLEDIQQIFLKVKVIRI